jgi:hypothetical protein
MSASSLDRGLCPRWEHELPDVAPLPLNRSPELTSTHSHFETLIEQGLLLPLRPRDVRLHSRRLGNSPMTGGAGAAYDRHSTET